MHALVRTAAKTQWMEASEPAMVDDGVMISVTCVGLCRTDLAVASGRLAVDVPRILGHEFAGRVLGVGSAVTRIREGDKVAADPVLACNVCDRCQHGWHHACHQARFLGVDADGAIAARIVIPERNVWRLPETLDDRIAALLEPVAACAAVLKAPIDASQSGVVLGQSRLSRLTSMILHASGFTDIRCMGIDVNDETQDRYDFAIDTEGSTASVKQLSVMLRPRGILILKSRPLRPIELDLRATLAKELKIITVNYAPFDEARNWLLNGSIDYSSLFGPTWRCHEYREAFLAAESDETCKHYLDVTSGQGMFDQSGAAEFRTEQPCAR